MEGVSKDVIIRRLERRYDYQSARFVMRNVLRKSGLPDKPDYSSGEVKKVCRALDQIGTRIDSVIADLQKYADRASGNGEQQSTADKPGQTAKRQPKKTDETPATKAAKDTPSKKDEVSAKAPAKKADEKVDEKPARAPAKKVDEKPAKAPARKAQAKATKASPTKSSKSSKGASKKRSSKKKGSK